MRKTLCVLAIAILSVLLVGAFFPALVTPHSEIDQDYAAILLAPGAHHLAGTDSLGRDLLARLLSATRVSLTISFLSSLISLLIGVVWGMFSGMAKDRVDMALMRVLDILYSIPDLLFYILLGLFLGRDMLGIIVALCSLSWISMAKLTRLECRKYKTHDFVTGARAMGLSTTAIAVRHLLPQMREVMFISLIFKIPALIALESSLSFIGLGLSPPHASFGTLAKEGFDAYLFYPHLIMFPFLFIFVTVFCFYAIGNYLSRKEN